jgi:hypothetical protein
MKKAKRKSSTIKVKNSCFIRLQHIQDRKDGDLFVGEIQKNIPFLIKRFFFVNIPSKPRVLRGFHAHKTCQQVIFCLNGSFKLHLDDGTKKQDIIMNDPSVGVLLGTKLWNTMTNFSRQCTLLVITSDIYDEKDYIRNYDDFLEYIKRGKR